MSSIKLKYKMDATFMNSKNSKTYGRQKLLLSFRINKPKGK